MFCIAAFIVLLVMSVVSARYRRYLGAAFSCTLRRATFRPCDTTFKQDMKDRMLAPIAARSPQLVRPASITIEILAVLVVLTTLWSGYEVVKSGLNLYVYGTCNKQDSASCSLGAESCSIPSATPDFGGSVATGDVIGAFANEFSSLGETISAIPARTQNWVTEDYLPANATYLQPFEEKKPSALEVIDPGCTYCKQLLENLEEVDFADRYNLSYVAYPIAAKEGYKFPNSLLVTQYLEALKLNPLEGAATPVDWQILERIYTEENAAGTPWQSRLNGIDNAAATKVLDGWLLEFGLTAEQIDTVVTVAASDDVADIIADNKVLVEDAIHTVKIPTIIYDGKRHDGLVKVDDLP